MLETLKTCPSCGSDKYELIRATPDHFLTKNTFNIVKCSNCGLAFTNPRPDAKSIIKYYKSDNYISHSNRKRSPIDIVYHAVRNYTLRQKLHLINRFVAKPDKLLDYGCGTGHFLALARKQGWKTIGLEPDYEARIIAQEKLGDDSIVESLSSISNEQFKIITLFHVLEHVHDLVQTFTSLHKMLLPNGTMIVALPNHLSWDAEKYSTYWAGYDVPRHLYHFHPETFIAFAKNFGLKIVAQLPMKFDSYYVSLLSEKYKGNPLYPLTGFLSGFISNFKARKSKQYSSLIYVLQKK